MYFYMNFLENFGHLAEYLNSVKFLTESALHSRWDLGVLYFRRKKKSSQDWVPLHPKLLHWFLLLLLPHKLLQRLYINLHKMNYSLSFNKVQLQTPWNVSEDWIIISIDYPCNILTFFTVSVLVLSCAVGSISLIMFTWRKMKFFHE